jgi:hypothetical protein
VLFAGGVRLDLADVEGSGLQDVVDMLDTTTGTWTEAHLSTARYGMAAASAGTVALLAGGETTRPRPPSGI